MSQRKLRMGMIGGGPGSFIGAVHRMAANLDGLIELACGAFSSQEARSREAGESLFLPADRVYGSFQEMITREAALPETARMDFVSIVTPNHVHFEPAKLALENGFHVVLDKPMTFDKKEALELQKIHKTSGKYFCLTHTYTGYPMVKEARQRVLSGGLGKIRKVYVEYPQGWLSNFVDNSGNKQAAWRTDPSKSGIAGCMGDIGTHAFHLAEYISGLAVSSLSADINIVVEGRKLDDDGAVFLKFNNGATGVLMATQIATGEENNIKIRVYGEKGSLQWEQDTANSLLLKWPDRPTEVLRTGAGYLSSFASHNTRTPAGHPEGYLEAFANLYRNFALCVNAERTGTAPLPEWLDFPGIEAGVRGMNFIEKAIESGKQHGQWIGLDD